MTAPVMYFGIGFFVAALLGVSIALRVHNRAARLGSVHADVANEVVRITQALESWGSPNELMSRYAALVTEQERQTQTLAINNASGKASEPTIKYGRTRRPHSCLADDSFARGGELKISPRPIG